MSILQRMCLYLALALAIPGSIAETETAYATENVNIRKEPTTESEILGKLYPGDSVERLEIVDDWATVLINGSEVYIHNDYLSLENPLDGYVCLGTFKVTAYCGGSCCNGKWAGKTSTGVKPEEGVTIAVAPWVIPYGSQIYIDGVGYRIAQDTGGFANRNDHQIDLFFGSHRSTEEWGIQYRKVWVK